MFENRYPRLPEISSLGGRVDVYNCFCSRWPLLQIKGDVEI